VLDLTGADFSRHERRRAQRRRDPAQPHLISSRHSSPCSTCLSMGTLPV